MTDETVRDASPDDPTRSITAAAGGQRSVGPFTIFRKLGEGGMGIVYEAEQQSPRRPVALKVMRGGVFVDDAQVKMFQREAQTLARLKHPSIAAIYEMGRTEEGQHFFAMELVRGETLGDWLKRGTAGASTPGSSPSPASDRRVRLGLFCKVCDAVAYAHQRGVIHRDLKPSNILVMKEAHSASSAKDIGVPDVKILDFGLARITDADVAMSTVVSELGSVKGTLPYMSPEQVRGNPDEIDLRTDVYSLGVILYELVTDRLPYDVLRAQLPEAVRVICEEPPKSLKQTASQRIDADVATIALKALEKEPARRYQSVAALADDVRRYLSDQPISARPPSAAYQFRKLVARHKVGFGFIAALFVVLVAFSATMAVQARRIAKERDRANLEAATSKQVSDFLVDLFHVADPNEARGNSITAREILDKGADKIERELKDQPAVQARLMAAMGQVYVGLGLYDRGEALLHATQGINERTYGPNSLEVAETYAQLASVLADKGRFHDAGVAVARATSIQERSLPPDDVRLARSLYLQGSVLVQQGQAHHTEGAALLERARRIFETKLGPDAIEVGWCWNDLSIERLGAGDLVAARDFAKRALSVKERALPPDHPDVAGSLNNFAFICVRQRNYEEARPLLERALSIMAKSYGENHEIYGNTLETMSELWWRSGNPAKALPYIQQAVAIREKTMAPGTSEIAADLMTLGAVLRDLHRFSEAEPYLKKALDLARMGEGRTPLTVAEATSEYAKLLRATGREAEARSLDDRVKSSESN